MAHCTVSVIFVWHVPLESKMLGGTHCVTLCMCSILRSRFIDFITTNICPFFLSWLQRESRVLHGERLYLVLKQLKQDKDTSKGS